MKVPDCYIGIDPGRGGGIAIVDRTGLKTHKMPKEIWALVDLLTEVNEKHQYCVTHIENVMMYRADAKTGGKSFGIVKMLDNYSMCKNALDIARVPFTPVNAITWQSKLKLRNKGESKTIRKKRFQSYAHSAYPNNKITLAVSDAVCIAIYGYKKIKEHLEMS